MRTFRRQDVSTTDFSTTNHWSTDVSPTRVGRFDDTFLGRFDDNPWMSVSWLSAGSTLHVLRVRVILSAVDVDCSFLASFSFRWLWFLVIWSSSQLVCMDCSFPASCAFPLWFLGVWFNGQFIHVPLLCSPPLDDRYEQKNKPVEGWQGTSRTMWSGSGAVSDDDVHMSVIVPCNISFETYFWRVFRAWPKNLSRSVRKTAFYGRASVASEINANICTGFMVILAIQHSHIFVVETYKMCRRNVCTSLQVQEHKRLTLTALLFITAVSAVSKTIAVVYPRNAFTVIAHKLSPATSCN